MNFIDKLADVNSVVYGAVKNKLQIRNGADFKIRAYLSFYEARCAL